MTKPTLMQTLLSKPSQTYSFPQEKEYFSHRQQMLRLATETNDTQFSSAIDRKVDYEPGVQRSMGVERGLPAMNHPGETKWRFADAAARLTPRNVQSHIVTDIHDVGKRSFTISPDPVNAEAQNLDPSDEEGEESEQDVFYTPDASPDTSMATLPHPASPKSRPSRRSLRAASSQLDIAATAPAEPQSTLLSSQPVNIRTTTTTTLSARQLPPPSPPLHSSARTMAVPSTRTPMRNTSLSHHRGHSSVSSMSSASLDGHSVFSEVMSDSTPLTTPLHSDSGHSSVSILKLAPNKSNPKLTPVNTIPAKDYAYTDEDWAKEVRWLVPSQNGRNKALAVTDKATTTTNSSSKRQGKKFQVHNHDSRRENSTQVSYFTATNGTPHPLPSTRGRIPNMSKIAPSIMMNMTALLEEDEDATTTPGAREVRTYHRQGSRSSVIVTGSTRVRTISGPSTSSRKSLNMDGGPGMAGTGAHGGVLRSSSRAHSSNLRLDPNKPQLRKRRSRSVGHESESSRSYTSVAAEVEALPQALGELPSHGTPGYTSLVLPLAPAPLYNSKAANNQVGAVSVGNGKVDLTRSGVAQTTMASVEVVRGLGSRRGFVMGVLGFGLGRRKTMPVGKEWRHGEDKGGIVARRGRGILGFTSYRKPPGYVPSGSVLVQVWAVGVDGIDGKLVGVKFGEMGISGGSATPEETENPPKKPGLGRSVSFTSKLGRSKSVGQAAGKEQSLPLAEVGYVPGRSFVGRVLECGWEVKEEVVRKGEWVVGMLDVKKCGALTEFIVVDRHRIHRVPHPRNDNIISSSPSASISSPTIASTLLTSSTSSQNTFKPPTPISPPALTLEELALLPLCGIPAYRAVRTFMFAFSSQRDHARFGSDAGTLGTSTGLASASNSSSSANGMAHQTQISDDHGKKRCALVLRGHDGAGAMAVQMLVLRGWRVCVHVPFPMPASVCAQNSGGDADAEEGIDRNVENDEEKRKQRAKGERYMNAMEERVRVWGGEEIIFDDGEAGGGVDGRGAAVRVMESLREDGDRFDAILDTIGGREVREAAERLLRAGGCDGDVEAKGAKGKKKGVGQFTTLVGDVPERTIPSAGDHFRAGLRSLRFGGSASDGSPKAEEGEYKTAGAFGKVGYAWISVAQDVDWEGEGVRESLGAVLRLALESSVRPCTSMGGEEPLGSAWEKEKVVPFECAPEIFVDDGPLWHGSTVVVKVAG